MKSILSKILLSVSFVVFVGFFAVSCDKKEQPRKSYKELIVGSWKMVSMERTVNGRKAEIDNHQIGSVTIFNPDGTAMILYNKRKVNYIISDGKIIMSDTDGKIVGQYHILELNDRILKVKEEINKPNRLDIYIVTLERVK